MRSSDSTRQVASSRRLAMAEAERLMVADSTAPPWVAGYGGTSVPPPAKLRRSGATARTVVGLTPPPGRAGPRSGGGRPGPPDPPPPPPPPPRPPPHPPPRPPSRCGRPRPPPRRPPACLPRRHPPPPVRLHT